MGEFKREQRYIVLKLKDIHQLPNSEQNELLTWLERLESLLPDRQYVCVESDWPEYEWVWAAIEARVTDSGSLVQKRIEWESERAARFEVENADLRAALAKSASREAALVEKLKVAEEALTSALENMGGGYAIWGPLVSAALAKIKAARNHRYDTGRTGGTVQDAERCK